MRNNKDNYNTRILIATLLSTLLMVLWVRFYGKRTIPNVEKKENIEIKQEIAKNTQKEELVNAKIKAEEKNLTKAEEQNLEDKFLIIETEKLKGSINLRGLFFNNLELEDYKKEINSNERVQLLSKETNKSGYYVELGWESNDKTLDLPTKDTVWTTNSEKLTVNNPVILSYTSKDDIIFQVIISIDKDYMFNFRQVVINNTDRVISLNVLNKIVRNEATAEETSAGVHEGFIGSFNNTIEEVKYKKLQKKDFYFTKNFSWAGFTGKYWLVSLASMQKNNANFEVETGYKNKDYVINFKSSEIILKPQQENEISSLLFSGPKILSLLDQYAFQYDLSLFDRSVDFGWFYFLTKPIYILLKMFYGFFGNFGVAILFLTFVVKFIMYPFTKKSYISMARLKSLQPKIDSIKSRYGDDKMKVNTELIELYKKENISPLSGCLPMLVQIPVFFSLYKVLVISIDMRQAPFFGYIKNLASKDPTTIWNLFGLLPYTVKFLPIGLLPCLMGLTMWIQQKMSATTSSSQDTQTATKVMPIIFLLMFAGMPAGLLIYWTFSNILTIAQQYYVERILLKKTNK